MSNVRYLCMLSGALALAGCAKEKSAAPSAATLLNVSYDPTRELFAELNPLFQQQWKAQKGQELEVKMSHGGSGSQARAVLEGLEADVVTLGLGYDVDVLAKGGLLPADWKAKSPQPWYSTIVFVVRKGNPKNIHDFQDLIRDGVTVVAANPKTSGAARWLYLAAWGVATAGLPDEQKQAAGEDYLKKLYAHVPVLDAGARGASTTFVRSGIGDVLLNWENEAHLLVAADPSLEVVTPKRSIRAEPPMAIVEKNAAKHGTAELAQAYLDFFSTDKAQQIAARHHFRTKGANTSLPTIELFTIEEVAGDWARAHAAHFADGALFDRIQAGIER